jgi:hypothetical protein
VSVNYGKKPGSRLVTGIQRAQLTRMEKLTNSILAYNAKLAARTPPVTWLEAGEITTLQSASLLAQTLLAQVT